MKGKSRPLFIAITLAVTFAGHAMIAIGFPGALHLGSLLVGVCYGSQWSLMTAVAFDLFGSANL